MHIRRGGQPTRCSSRPHVEVIGVMAAEADTRNRENEVHNRGI